MAGRITVVISQSATANSQLRTFEDDLIAELLFQDAVDLTVIPDLTQLASDSTGLLCLEGIRGPMVLIADADAQTTHQRLADHDVHGQLGLIDSDGAVTSSMNDGPAELGPGIYDAMQRTIYCLALDSLESTDNASATISSIRQHLANSRIRGRSDFPMLASADSGSESSPDPATSDTSVRPVPKRQSDSDDDDPAVTDLLDELDEMDL